MSKLLLIDLSYLIFYKYYALISWSKLTDTDLTDLSIFKTKLYRNVEISILGLKKKYCADTVILAKDTPNQRGWRKELFGGYKSNRAHNDDNMCEVFTYIYTVAVPQISEEYDFNIVSVEGVEADDVIATAVKRLYDQYDITIVTNDHDFLQLINKYENLKIYNLQAKEIKQKYTDIELKHFTMWKVIKGDKSDAIPAIDKKVGAKTAIKLALNQDLLQARLSNPEVRQQFELNKKLMDFDCIPKDMAEMIEAKLKAIYL